jgi:hypothetical protein
MYRQGLGDCFLLSFPRGPGEAHVLIDCGVLKGTEDGTAWITRAAESILETTGGRLDVLVVTHQHWDHVSGFLQAQAVFDQMEIGEVWLAWTEDPADDLARELAERRGKAAAAVEGAVRRLAGAYDAATRHAVQRLKAVLGFIGEQGVAGRNTTAQAMEPVKRREGARLRYFKPGGKPVELPGAEGVRVYVLGPPRDPKLLRKSDPGARAGEVYELAGLGGPDLGFLAAVAALDSNGPGGGQPFDVWFQITEAEAWVDDFFGENYGFDGEDDLGWRRIESDWLSVAGRLALQLDSHTNNTSLALAFELSPSGRVLLFPGDAQVGNWMSWAGQQWHLKEGSEGREVTAADLLARTVLYKVGHHGSHNATLRELGLELMASRELTAMLPVDRKTAKILDWNMPFPTLYSRLQEKANGRILDLETGLPDKKPDVVSDQDWNEFLARTSVHSDWVDYRVDL